MVVHRPTGAAGLGSAASAGLNPTIDPFMYSIDATVRDGRTVQEVEAALLAEIDKLHNGDATQAELDKARKQARALFAYSTETVTGQAFWLAYFEHVAGGHEWFLDFERRLNENGVMCRRLHTSHAFHSSMMDPVIAPLSRRVVKKLSKICARLFGETPSPLSLIFKPSTVT